MITAIRQTTVADAEAMCRFYRDNADHLRPWEPLRRDGYHSVANWRQRLCDRVRRHVIDYAFKELQLNRIMANYIPANQ
jgi:ribosomal-protein-alanine N-acetyltransferase